MKDLILHPIATIYTDLPEKFGIPRQSGRVPLKGRIVFEKEYRVKEALRGIEEFSHLWLLWDFSENHRENWSPTVRPPRLGGNKRMGVFATRSSFRPNPIGLSSVKLEKVDIEQMELYVSGVDLMNGTPIFDIKPYLPFTDAHPDASGGFASAFEHYELQIDENDPHFELFSKEDKETLLGILKEDPRPSYQGDERGYFLNFKEYEIAFHVSNHYIHIDQITKKSTSFKEEH